MTHLPNAPPDLVKLALVGALGPDLAADVPEVLIKQRPHLGRLVGREEDRLPDECGLAVEIPRLNAREVTAVRVGRQRIELAKDELPRGVR